MSIKLKLLLFFLGAYALSVLSVAIFTFTAVKELLLNYMYDYMYYQVKPTIEFYKSIYVYPPRYIKLLASDVVSREMASLVLNKKGNLIYKEPFMEGEGLNLTEDNMRLLIQNRKGIINNLAFLVIDVGDYKLILLEKMDKVLGIERKLLTFLTAFTLFISLLTSLILTFFVKRMLWPLSYLTDVSREVYRGNMDIKVEKGKGSDELAVLQNAYGEMLEKLRRTFQWQKEFIAGVAHELKTPLTYIKGQLELLNMGVYKEDMAGVLKNMLTQSNKMERLINHLVLLMRLESGIPLKLLPLSVNEVLAELDEEYEFVRETHKFHVEYVEKDVEILADKSYIKIALGNLIENSYKYTPEGGMIKLYFINNCFLVEDNGIGIKNIEKVLERFYREVKYKEGFGLGLSIVKAVADAHRFKLNIESKKGHGTKVSLCII
ncbi:MAG: sensor histidine kinase [Aquificaceae bacterium]